ncbi:MAG: FliI/YscN family ATPase [Acidobacteria bacterium]|nr:FliI/YscN family ATPase [Acidobacteriota bacterium]MBI3657837.1 FliI/YscN family ATPase [Acidobacteriota bacterium]
MGLEKYRTRLQSIETIKLVGAVKQAVGLVLESYGPPVSVGELCDIYNRSDGTAIPAEVIGFRDHHVLTMPLYKLEGVRFGDVIVARRRFATVRVGDGLLGRIMDGVGNPLDGKGPIIGGTEYPLHSPTTNPLRRRNIDQALSTGVRVIDALLTTGKGQRMGIFGGSGIGKSTLLGMMAKYTSADINVISLVGERGREVREFIEKDLGEEGLRRSVVVVSTSDNPPLLRLRGALVATAVAEYFRDQGRDVLLVMDSLTRFAMAQREIGLAAGEPPASKGYTPSVFSLLPRMLERAGNFENSGSITGFYTVLVEGDDMNEPIADAARSLLDGHIVLSRELAWRNHFPSIDVLSSISRLMTALAAADHTEQAGRLRELLAVHKKAEDMINIGAYTRGSSPKIDLAISHMESINAFLRQKSDEKSALAESIAALRALL